MSRTAREMSSEAPARRRPPWVRPLIVVVVVVVCGWLAARFLGAIDWAAVGSALSELSAWQVPVLLALLLVRQTLNALPLALYIQGLGLRRALVNDLTAHLMSVVAPPPGDVVMRLAMFRSWKIDDARALAGTTMNMLTFYINRFAAPILGLVVLLVFGTSTERAWTAVASGLVAVVMTVLVFLVVRGEGFAARLGAAAGVVARRFRSTVDPQSWAAAATEFQGHVFDKYRRGFPRSLAGLSLMVLCDASILLLCLRFVGVTGADLPAYEVLAAFLLAYPLTIPPLMGLGIFDLVLLGAFLEVGGQHLEPQVVAGLTVWRCVTLLGPILLGVGTSVWWRWSKNGGPVKADELGA